MKKGLNEEVFLIDCSESMEANADKVIADFNRLLDEYKTNMSEALVTTIMFNERSKIFHDRIDINDAKPLSEENYTPSGKTALIDALGLTIKHIATIQKYARDEDKPEHTVFVVMTDGKEDASKRYTADEVEKFVTIRKEIFGWEFIFTSAGFDTIITACKVGQTADADTDTEGGYDIDINDLLKIFENKKS